MALHQSWAHGTAFAPPEFPSLGLYEVDQVRWTDVVGMRKGWGSIFQGQPGGSNWFHVSIPTPAIIEGARVTLQQVFVLFNAGDPAASSAGASGTNITDIHVWDGPNRIRTFGSFNLFGKHHLKVDGGNAFPLPNKPQVSLGIGISVRVTFKNVGKQRIEFSAAGADFDI